jgi:hypothetical protein
LAIQKSVEDCLPKQNPLERPDYTEAEVQAVRAVWRGEADARQQRLALDCLVRIFGTHDTSYRPGDPHGTAFAEGRRNAGTTLVWLIRAAPTKTDPDKIATRRLENDDATGRSEQRPGRSRPAKRTRG